MKRTEAEDLVALLRALDEPDGDREVIPVLVAAGRLARAVGDALGQPLAVDMDTLAHTLDRVGEGCCCTWDDQDLAGAELVPRAADDVPDPAGRLSDPITPPQRKVRDEIRRRVQADGYPPSIRDVAEATGLTLSTVKYALDGLVGKGYVQRVAGKPRAIRLVDPEAVGS